MMTDFVERLRLKMTHASVLDRRYAKPMSWNEAELLISEIDRLNAENARLRAGGCARDQTTTQFCAEAAALQAENTRLREALQDIFDYECQFSSTSLIACTAKDALAGEEKKS